MQYKTGMQDFTKIQVKNQMAHYQLATYLQLLRQFTVHKSGGKVPVTNRMGADHMQGTRYSGGPDERLQVLDHAASCTTVDGK